MECRIYKGHAVPEAKGVCVVIDVLRAFTTAAFAFEAGAKEIIFVKDVEEAFHKHRKDPSLILMGEVDGKPIEGFHFHNSPLQVKRAALHGKKIVQRTSSGTQGVVGCSHAKNLLISSFVLAEATLQRIEDLNPSHVSFICTGRNNGDEDVALADYLSARLLGHSYHLEGLLDRVRKSPAAHRMLHGDIAYADAAEDLRIAASLESLPFAVEVFQENGELVGRPVLTK